MENNLENKAKLKRRKFLKQSFNELADKISSLKIRQNKIEGELKILNFELLSYDLEQKKQQNK